MSKLLDVLDKIKEGSPSPLGFSVIRPEKLPGMALIGLVSKDYAKGIVIVKTEGLDALILANSGDPKDVNDVTENLDGKPWGVKVSGLSRDNAQAYQDSGADALVLMPLVRTTMGAHVRREVGRRGIPWISCPLQGRGTTMRALEEAVQVEADAFARARLVFLVLLLEVVDDEVADLLAKTGGNSMAFAPESGSARTRKLIKKQMTRHPCGTPTCASFG